MLSRNSGTGGAASRAAKSRTPSFEVKPRRGPRDIDRLGQRKSGGERYSAQGSSALRRRSSLLGVLQNDAAPMIVDDPPFFDLIQGSKTAQAGQVVVQATISDAR